MTAVSMGYFDPTSIYADTATLISALKASFGPRLRKMRAWPLAVSSIRWEHKGMGVAYALIGGHIPIHIDTIGLDDSDGRIFQFVLEVENRPMLLTAPRNVNNDTLIGGETGVWNGIGFGALELHAGMAVHFDITDVYHGVSGLPVPMEATSSEIAPRAVIIQVSGFAANQIGEAIEHAATWVGRDMLASNAGNR